MTYSYAIVCESSKSGLEATRAAIPEDHICCDFDEEPWELRISQNGSVVATICHSVNEEGKLYLRQHLIRQDVQSHSLSVGSVSGNASGEVLSLELAAEDGDKRVKLRCIGNEIRTPSHDVVARYKKKRARMSIHSKPYLEVTKQSFVLPSFVLLVASRIFTQVVWSKRLDRLAKQHDLTQYDKRMGMVVNEQAPSGWEY